MSSVPVLSEGPDWKCGTSVVGRSDQSQRQFWSNHQEARSLRKLGDNWPFCLWAQFSWVFVWSTHPENIFLVSCARWVLVKMVTKDEEDGVRRRRSE